jgi:hypothetical protein
MEKLVQFTETIRSIKSSLPAAVINQPVTATEAYHGQLLEVDDEYSYEPPDLTGIMMMKPEKELDGWFVGKLKCKRHIDDSYRDTISTNNNNINSNTGDGRRVDDYAVIDPRKK